MCGADFGLTYDKPEKKHGLRDSSDTNRATLVAVIGYIFGVAPFIAQLFDMNMLEENVHGIIFIGIGLLYVGITFAIGVFMDEKHNKPIEIGHIDMGKHIRYMGGGYDVVHKRPELFNFSGKPLTIMTIFVNGLFIAITAFRLVINFIS